MLASFPGASAPGYCLPPLSGLNQFLHDPGKLICFDNQSINGMHCVMSSETDQVPPQEPKKSNDPVPADPTATSAGASGDYGAEQIEALKGLEGIRMRPAMYIGGTDGR